MKRYLLLCAILGLGSGSAPAWNAVGHRAVAEIAWRQLDDSQRRALSGLLKQHPHYDTMLVQDVPAGVDTNEWAWLIAASWPDLLRSKPGHRLPSSITKYSVYPHGVLRPFVQPGDRAAAGLALPEIPVPNAETGLADSIRTLQDPRASAHDRAVSLAWVAHLMGDLHQPLHAATLVSARHPAGSGLGAQQVVRSLTGEREGLHTLWDRLPGLDYTYPGAARLADELTANPKLRAKALPELRRHLTPASWGEESFRVATEFAYSPKHVQYAWADDLKAGRISEADIPRVRPEYLHEGRERAHRRLALAGHRLTRVLRETWPGQ